MMYPKIGIRPVIDGRWGGIRESLEAQTMGMAHAAKALIETLKYPDGTPVQVVVSPCTIGGGIGQSRLCMFLMGTAHIGEVQSSVWDDDTVKQCEAAGIILL